ncbi:MAG: hypothetical protein E6K14_01820 [Methanobacteriota archaeon]|nr:MAG: hypothetical protein E6K14_01820 [Euryarchaeota archaeon]
MRGERYQNAMAILLLVLVLASVPLILNLSGWWFLWTPILAALAILPAVFLREPDLGTGPRSPADVRDALASALQGAGVSVTAMPGAVVTRIQPLSAVRFRWRVTDAGTVLSYDVRPTRAGWALLAALVATAVGSPLAIALALALGWRARRFARSRGPAALAASTVTSAPPPSDEVRTLLVGSLSSGLRVVERAYDAQRKAYTDARVLAVLGGFVLWTVLLVSLFLVLNGVNLLTGRWEIPIVGATTGAILTGGALLVASRRRYGARLSRYLDWTSRLGEAMGREMARTAEPPSIDAQRKAGLSADPKMGFAILVLSALSASMIVNAVYAALFGILSAIPIWVAAAALPAGIAALLWHRWRREEDARLAESRSTWDAHVRALRARMDRFLEEM